MSERQMFVEQCLRRRHCSIAELCAQFGISEKTGYKWLRRYQADGPAGLADRSHAPHHPAHRVRPEVADALKEFREQHPTWGARKLLARLPNRATLGSLPAPSTVTALLQREGLVRQQRRRRSAGPGMDRMRTCATAPNDVWTADFKGEFLLRHGPYCYPLTVVDDHTRFLLGCTGLPGPTLARTQTQFERLFREYGLPTVLRTDNGPPFAHPHALGRLSRLAIWWIRLGIRPERITPGRPGENGRHERMHRTLKEETTHPPAATFPAQQRCFDAFRHEYNHERPHEALNQTPPADHYTPSPRPYPSRLPRLEYDTPIAVRRVDSRGRIKWRGRALWLTSALEGEDVGLAEIADGIWHVFFGPLLLGEYEPHLDAFGPRLVWHDGPRPDVPNAS